MSHTEGPWRAVYDGSSVWSIGEDEDPQVLRVATVERRGGLDSWYEASDNAQLIAAAPELLAAMKRLFETGLVRDFPDTPEYTNALAAIAKAEGD